MKYRIRFWAESSDGNAAKLSAAAAVRAAPRPSVVQVYFAERKMKLAYYNDRFDLQPGDLVYVEGKLEGIRGRVVEVSYNFWIRMSDYKRVIAVADTSVNGRFFMAGSHFVTFSRTALPAEKTLSWYKAPENGDEEFVCGYDDTSFSLDDPDGMRISAAAAERGHNYYLENRVRYLCIDGGRGYAIVEGTKPYETEFEYRGGRISGLRCSCFCSGNCKHEFAVMLQLKETLEWIGKNHAAEYERTGYFAAVSKEVLFTFAASGKETGSFTLQS
ncbi:MAG: hypothetical protein IKM31_11285 [Oscillospiraceae bacterium]|nr:hypothetical protein [Oscillospiraceae bacterium]